MKKVVVLLIALVCFLSINLVALQPAKAYSIQGITEKAVQVRETVSKNTLQAGKTVTEVATDVGEVVGSRAMKAGQVTIETAVDVGGSLGTKALQVSKTTAETAIDVGSKVGSTTLQVGKSVLDSTTEVGTAAANETLHLIGQATQGLEQATNTVAQLVVTSFEKNAQPLLEFAIEQVDLNQLEAGVNKIRQDHPEHTPLDLAHYFIGQRTIESSTTDSWVDIARFEAEMVYQVASAHGFDLQDVARKKEIIEISAAGLGSSRAIQASMFLLKFPIGQIPVAGDLINMGLDLGSGQAVTYLMFQFLGNEACKYYASHSPTVSVSS